MFAMIEAWLLSIARFFTRYMFGAGLSEMCYAYVSYLRIDTVGGDLAVNRNLKCIKLCCSVDPSGPFPISHIKPN